MDDFFQTLISHKDEILEKDAYYVRRLSGKSKEVERQAREARSKEILPWIFERYNPKVSPDLKMTVFSAIIKIVNSNPYYLSFCFLEDENRERCWAIQEMDVGDTFRPFYFLFTQHYIERYTERNKSFIRYTGNIKEAIILDIFSGAALYKSGLTSELLGQFIYPSEIMKLGDTEREELMKNLKELAGATESELGKYLDLKNNVCITKTVDGYGIYNMENDCVTFITWFSKNMMGEKKMVLFETITQEILTARVAGLPQHDIRLGWEHG